MVEKYKAFREKSSFFLTLTLLILVAGCNPASKIAVSMTKKAIVDPGIITITKVKIANNQILITGTNLNTVTNFKIKEGSNDTNLHIESKTNTSIVANTLSNITFSVGKILDLVLSNASAASTFRVDFSLCDATLGGEAIDCIAAPTDKQVLSYDFNSKTWRPRSVSGLSYKGVWSALTPEPSVVAENLIPGDYYVVGIAGGLFSAGDWIVLNEDGTTFERVENAPSFALSQMIDINFSTPPVAGNALVYSGGKWIPQTITAGGAGTVTSVSGGGPISVATGTTTPVISISQATTTTNGYLSSGDWNTFNGKQAALPTGSTLQYFRGDKTLGTLDTGVVPENGNLYFTNARALGIQLTGFNNALTGQVAATDTMLQAFGRVQNQINSLSSTGSNYLIKNAPDTLSGAISLTSVITATSTGDIVVNSVPLTVTSAVNKIYADGKLDKTTGGVVAGVVTLDNDLKIKGGSNYVTIRGHATSANYNFVLPSTAGTAGYFLSTDGSGNTSWVSAGGGGAPSGAATGDLGGSYPAPTVATVGGVTAANVASGATLANNATTANTANTIVKRDGSGNFSATNISGIAATTNGGTGANITPVNGGIIYSNATTMAVTAAGTTGQVLKSNGAATPTWLSLGTASNVNTGVLAGNVPVLAANAVDDSICTYDTVLGFNCNTAMPTSGTPGGSDTQIQFNNGGVFAGNANFVWDNTNGRLGIGATTPGSTLDVKGTLRLSGSTSGYVGFAPAAAAGSTTYTLPSADGSSGQILRTNGSGVLSWVNDNAGAGAFTGTADKAVVTNGSGALATIATSATELGYVTGVTSSIQTQLNAKQASGNYVTALTGDVTATGPGSVAATVASVGGVTAANVATGVNLANAATTANTANTIVKRDGSGNFSATNVSGTVAVANGGTGATTLGSNQLLFGNGTGAIGNLATTATPSVLLSTVTTGAPAWTTSTAGNVLKGSVSGVQFGPLSAADLPAGTLSGAGTINYIPYYNATNTLANSPLTVQGSDVGIGVTNPTTKLDVNGTIKATAFVGDGSGITGIAASAGGMSTEIQFNNGGVLGASSYMNWNDSGRVLQVGMSPPSGMLGGWGGGVSARNLFVGNGTDAWMLWPNAGQLRLGKCGDADCGSFSDRIIINGAGSTLDVKGILKLSGSTSGYVGFAPAAAAGSTIYTLPIADGTSGQVLTTNGSSVLSWSTASGGGGAPTGAAGGDLSGTYPNPTITALDAAKVGGGAVSNTEFSYLDGVTSSIQTQLTGKEPAITAGTTAQYLRGDKSLATFSTDVRATTLTGLSSTAGSITASDTVLSAFGKMLNTQSDYVSKSGNTTVTGSFNITGITAFLNIPTPTGATLTEAANVDYVQTYVGAPWTKSGASDAYRSGGNVSIGAVPSTNTKLNVEGQIRSKSFSQATGAIDWANGNSGTTSYNCAAPLTFASLRDGGSYTLAVTSTATTQCTFSTTTTGDDAGTVSYRFIPANAVRTASSHSIYSFQRIGSIVYISWITGF